MGLVANLAGEMAITSPAGNVKIWLATSGLVVVEGSEPMENRRWFLDQFKAAVQAFKTGKAPQGFKVSGTEAYGNKAWYLKLLQAAHDVVNSYGEGSSIRPLPNANAVMQKARPGSPYRFSES